MKKLGAVLFGFLMLQACSDNNDTGTTFVVTLTAANVVPPCAAVGPAATGTATIVVSADGRFVTVHDFTFSGLTGGATDISIHTGSVGQVGPVIFDFGTVLVSPIGPVTFSADNFPSPVPQGAPGTFDAFINAMRAQNAYIQIDTLACPDGEIRAQIE